MFKNPSTHSIPTSHDNKPASFIEDPLFLGKALPVLSHLANEGVYEIPKKRIVQFAEDELTKDVRLMFYNAMHTSVPIVGSTPIWALFALQVRSFHCLSRFSFPLMYATCELNNFLLREASQEQPIVTLTG